MSNKARSIARPPLNPFRNTLDFLDEQGQRLTLTEEFPVYTGLLGLAYRLVGERDWVGRFLSLMGTLVAIAAYADLTRREYGRWIADAGAFLLAVAPLLIFYGRAVMPDPWMLAAMLIAAACYRRHLDGAGRGWLIAAACAAALAPLCKYYGVMILIPLAGMTVHCKEHRDRRGLRFLVMSTATVVPVGLWMFAVFLRTANPVASGWSGDGTAMPYLVFQTPRLAPFPWLLRQSFCLRFLFLDCGPVTSALIVWGRRGGQKAMGSERGSSLPPAARLLVADGPGVLLHVRAQARGSRLLRADAAAGGSHLGGDRSLPASRTGVSRRRAAGRGVLSGCSCWQRLSSRRGACRTCSGSIAGS